ncbi:MAG TPA: outer membrane beta-barrel protein [Rhizomicrobium sp.]
MPIRPIFAGLALAALWALQAAAQIDPADRPHPEYDAPGVAVGSFRLHPMLDVGANYDDNVYRTPTDLANDVFFNIAPSFDLKSDWSEHMLDLTAGVVRDQYLTHTKESITNWDVGSSGRLDILQGTELDADASYAALHEPRTSPDLPGNAAAPTPFSDAHGDVTFTHDPGLLGISLGGTFDRFNFSDTPLDGGSVQDNQGRDEDQYSAFAKAIYNLTDQSSLFLRGTYNTHNYDLRVDNPDDRTSHGFAADAGFDLFFTHLIRGEVYAGYESQNFIAPYQSASGIDYGATLTWYATELMTAHLTASRKFDDTTITGASVSDDQSVDAGFDYEILRPLIFKADVSYLDSNFVGAARQDHVFGATAGLDYLLNQYMRAYASYTFSHRNSDAPDQDFTDSLISAGLKFGL